MAITFQDWTHSTLDQSDITGGESVVTKPSGVSAGDILLLILRGQGQNVDPNAVVLPDGFQRITPPGPNPAGQARLHVVAYKVVTSPGAEPASYTLGNSNFSGQRNVVAMCRVVGARVVNPITDSDPEYAYETSGAVRTVPTLSVDGANSVQVLVVGAEVTSGNAMTPSFVGASLTQHAVWPVDDLGATTTSVWIGSRVVNPATAPGFTVDTTNLTAGSTDTFIIADAMSTPRLPTPVVQLGNTVNPSSPSASDGSQTVFWDNVPGASGYSAHWAEGSDPDQGDFVQRSASVTSPHTFTGLSEGMQSFGIRAEV